jgi:hypothetical protein
MHAFMRGEHDWFRRRFNKNRAATPVKTMSAQPMHALAYAPGKLEVNGDLHVVDLPGESHVDVAVLVLEAPAALLKELLQTKLPCTKVTKNHLSGSHRRHSEIPF